MSPRPTPTTNNLRAQIVLRLRAGDPFSAIASQLGVGSERVSRIAREEGIQRQRRRGRVPNSLTGRAGGSMVQNYSDSPAVNQRQNKLKKLRAQHEAWKKQRGITPPVEELERGS